MYGDGYGLPECCYVAWLKNLSRNPVALREDTSEKELAQSVLNELCEHDRIYGFSKIQRNTGFTIQYAGTYYC